VIKNRKLKLSLLYIVYAILIFVVLSLKKDFFVDELLTYNLANGKGWLDPVQNSAYTPASVPFIEAFTTDGTFDAHVVWYRQELDVHPPFYYLLVHILSCLSPGSVSVYIAGAINVVFMILTLFFVRKLIDVFCDNEYVNDIISIAFILSAGILSISSLLRMYCMAMFFVTAFSYILIKYFDNYQLKIFFGMYVITVMGALTHYYYILYAFLICSVVGVMMLTSKRWKETIGLIFSMALAGISSYLIFPAMVEHIFHSYRGTESIGNLKNSDLPERFSTFGTAINKQIFGGMLWIALVFILICAIKKCIIRIKVERNTQKLYVRSYYILSIPVILYLLAIIKSAPILSVRYLSPVFAVSFVLVLTAVYNALSDLIDMPQCSMILLCLLCTFITCGSYINAEWEYLFKDHSDELEYASQNAYEFDAICIYEASWRVVTSYKEMAMCKSSSFYQLTTFDDFKALNVDLPDNIALFLIYTEEGFLEEFEKTYPDYTIIKDNGHFGYADVYYLSR